MKKWLLWCLAGAGLPLMAAPWDDGRCVVPAKKGGGFDLTCQHVRGDGDHGYALRPIVHRTDQPGRGQTVHTRHLDIHENEIESGVPAKPFDRLISGRDANDSVARAREQDIQKL